MVSNDSVNNVAVSDRPVVIVVFGASGDLAKKKTFPALFGLYRMGYMPETFSIIGFARSAMTTVEFREKMTVLLQRMEKERPVNDRSLSSFLGHCDYMSGQYAKEQDYDLLKRRTQLVNSDDNVIYIFYMAVPPSVFMDIAKNVSIHFKKEESRLVVEKPFGKDTATSGCLQMKLSQLFPESQVFRIDHYLGKEMVKNLLVLRFANLYTSAFWHKGYISNVQITFKEDFGAEGRGGYFDEYGIIRDVVQNHMMQILALVAMDQPLSLDSESIRDEKTRILRCVQPARTENMVLGQYIASSDGKNPGYQDDPTVRRNSRTPTFATIVLFIDHPLWEGVPFIIKCGKALNTRKTEIRLQFKDVPGSLFPDPLARNELVIRVSPSEAVYLKVMNKQPGIAFQTTVSELDLTYKARYANITIPDAYESLLLDVLRNDQGNFVRSDELDAAWKIFTPLLHDIDEKNMIPEKYEFGSRGPTSADDLAAKHGFVVSPIEYDWKTSQNN